MTMTATSPVAAGNRGGSRSGSQPPVLTREVASRPRRRPGLWIAGGALVVMGGLLAALLVGRAGDRVEVVAVARTVPVGQTIGEADVTVARVAADPVLTPIPAARRGEVVGRTAAVELRAGTLLTDAQVTDAAVPGAGEQLVGIAARPGQLPARGLRPGDRVLIVPVPGDQARTGVDAGGAGAIGGQPVGESVAARVAQVGPVDADGAVTVDVVVEQELGPRVAALASTGRVALVLQPGGGR